uniref:Uncharacterized protein n=1 Tax=Cucumis melo TaxID=3656 RepID=A0A9I9EI99_CUCME
MKYFKYRTLDFAQKDTARRRRSDFDQAEEQQHSATERRSTDDVWKMERHRQVHNDTREEREEKIGGGGE